MIRAARFLVVALLLLSFATGGWEVRLRLVRPPCCEGPDSCCPPDHSADCCQPLLQITTTKAHDDPARLVEAAPSLPANDLVTPALAPALSLVVPVEIAWSCRAHDLAPRPPPDLIQAVALRL
ncbi:hypothetical protein HY251_02630 [bacterium]|nr:hypothetical protein [bacterium]